MSALRIIFFSIAILLLNSCSSTLKFPISSVTPAAEIKVNIKKDKHNNHVIKVTAVDLAGADRLIPPKNNYIIWIVTERNGIKNVGQLTSKNEKKSYLISNTPFIIKEVFITAEEQGNISYPSGIEITKVIL